MKKIKLLAVILIVISVLSTLSGCLIRDGLYATGLPIPDPITTSSRIVEVYANGGGVSLALTEDGTLLAWGENTLGQLGIGTNRGQYEDTTKILQTYWLSPVLVMEYVPEG